MKFLLFLWIAVYLMLYYIKNMQCQNICPSFCILPFSYFRLRALSSGGSITSPPLSPALPKYKLADYRYGREEMLALFLKDYKVRKYKELRIVDETSMDGETDLCLMDSWFFHLTPYLYWNIESLIVTEGCAVLRENPWCDYASGGLVAAEQSALLIPPLLSLLHFFPFSLCTFYFPSQSGSRVEGRPAFLFLPLNRKV